MRIADLSKPVPATKDVVFKGTGKEGPLKVVKVVRVLLEKETGVGAPVSVTMVVKFTAAVDVCLKELTLADEALADIWPEEELVNCPLVMGKALERMEVVEESPMEIVVD